MQNLVQGEIGRGEKVNQNPHVPGGQETLPLDPKDIPRELRHLYDDRVPDAPSAKRGRVRLSREMIRETARVFNAKGAAALDALADESPIDFLRLVATIIPKPDSLESQNETPLSQLSDTELDQLRDALVRHETQGLVLIEGNEGE